VYDVDVLHSHKFIVYWQIYIKSERGFPITFEPHFHLVQYIVYSAACY